MMCCVCSGSCCHTGPHMYCAMHSLPTDVPVAFPPYLWPTTTMQLPRCEHCYCAGAGEAYPEHRQCCKCFTRMHIQFIGAGLTEKS